MLQITLDEFVNGYSLTAYDPKDGYLVRELHEEKVEALKAIALIVDALLKKEYKVILQVAGEQN